MARLVALAIANHADPFGAGAFPSAETIAKKGGMARATVFRNLQVLEALGEIERISGGGRHKTNLYRLKLASPQMDLLPGIDRRKPSQFQPETVSPVRHEPSLTVNQKLNPARNQRGPTFLRMSEAEIEQRRRLIAMERRQYCESIGKERNRGTRYEAGPDCDVETVFQALQKREAEQRRACGLHDRLRGRAPTVFYRRRVSKRRRTKS